MEGRKLLVSPKLLKRWSGRRDSNPRRPAWEAGILPLNYSRLPFLSMTSKTSFHPEHCLKTAIVPSGFSLVGSPCRACFQLVSACRRSGLHHACVRADPPPACRRRPNASLRLHVFSASPESSPSQYQPFPAPGADRKSTRLNSSHLVISYAV